MNLDSDGMDDIISQESPLDMEGNYKKVRRGRALLFVNNRTIFLTGRRNTLEEWPNSTLGSHCHNIFRKAKCTEVEAKLGGFFFLLSPACIH